MISWEYKRIQAHLKTAVTLIQNYRADVPLKHYLQQYFSINKKHGSKDRKYISHFCYCYYRLGHALKELAVEERLIAALSVCDNNSFVELKEYLETTSISIDTGAIFPWKNMLSEGIEVHAFTKSFLQQPDLFIRIRPNAEKSILQKLSENNISYQQLSSTCLALSNTTKVDKILQINREAVIQDLSSQRVGAFLGYARDTPRLHSELRVWDCCAASGGKSIMAYDIIGNIELTVSDVRPSIIKNLKERFQKAGIKKYQSFIADLTDPKFQLPSTKYDLIIADVPCTGSGTWARTPEQLYFFDSSKIDHYRKLQESIVAKVIPALKPGGVLLYITCSVFKKENEEMVDFIEDNFNLHLDKMELLKGYTEKADSMFVAKFIKP